MLDQLTRTALKKPHSNRRILIVSDGVMKGKEIIQAAASFRAQESIHSTTTRILEETGCRVK